MDPREHGERRRDERLTPEVALARCAELIRETRLDLRRLEEAYVALGGDLSAFDLPLGDAIARTFDDARRQRAIEVQSRLGHAGIDASVFAIRRTLERDERFLVNRRGWWELARR